MGDTAKINVVIGACSSDEDQAWLVDLWRQEWGGTLMISRGKVHQVSELNALIARIGEERVGAATYEINGLNCELTSIDALRPGSGIGTNLLQAVEGEARASGCSRLWLISTNDNTGALRFYQRRGFVLCRLHAGAITESRRIKPSIPLIGRNGIPIRDELELEKRLG